MLNYLWAGLIVLSLAFALYADGRDLAADTYRNGRPLPVQVTLAAPFDAAADAQPATLTLDPAQFAAHYGLDALPDSAEGALTFPVQLRRTETGYEVRLDDPEAALPDPLPAVRDVTNPRDKVLQGRLAELTVRGAEATGALQFAPVRFVKLQAITAAALEFAETAAGLALGLVGVLVLFLGLMQIAQDAGIVEALVRLVRPVLRPLFPEVPDGHPALGFIALNLAANVFGLGNAATPFGIKAMESLQTLNPDPDTATDPMVMLLAINTASVQLVPPVLLVALIGLEVNQVYFAIVLATLGATAVAILAVKLLGRTRRFRASRPTGPAPSPAPPAA